MRPVMSKALLVAFLLSLSGCAATGAPAASSSPVSPESSSPTPTVSPSAALEPATAVIPQRCEDLVSPTVYQTVFAGTPLNDPGFLGDLPSGRVNPSAAPADATTTQEVLSGALLRCYWRDPRADTTGIFIDVGEIDSELAADHRTTLEEEGSSCIELLGGIRCQRIEENPMYPVDDGYTFFSRDETFIDVYQSNYPTSGLLDEMVGTIWG